MIGLKRSLDIVSLTFSEFHAFQANVLIPDSECASKCMLVNSMFSHSKLQQTCNPFRKIFNVFCFAKYICLKMRFETKFIFSFYVYGNVVQYVFLTKFLCIKASKTEKHQQQCELFEQVCFLSFHKFKFEKGLLALHESFRYRKIITF